MVLTTYQTLSSTTLCLLLQGEEAAKVYKQYFSPNEGLDTGKLVLSGPTFEDIVGDIPRDFHPPRDKIVKGSILDSNVLKGR